MGDEIDADHGYSLPYPAPARKNGIAYEAIFRNQAGTGMQ
jgi:hypothetical protein